MLERALTTNPTRLLLADEVGLGKSIEAGLIVRELKARGRVRRIVIVAPKGIQLQWVAEFHNRFGEELVRVGPEGLPVNAGVDPWRAFDQVVCSIDAVKPLRQRAGWSPERIAATPVKPAAKKAKVRKNRDGSTCATVEQTTAKHDAEIYRMRHEDGRTWLGIAETLGLIPATVGTPATASGARSTFGTCTWRGAPRSVRRPWAAWRVADTRAETT